MTLVHPASQLWPLQLYAVCIKHRGMLAKCIACMTLAAAKPGQTWMPAVHVGCCIESTHQALCKRLHGPFHKRGAGRSTPASDTCASTSTSHCEVSHQAVCCLFERGVAATNLTPHQACKQLGTTFKGDAQGNTNTHRQPPPLLLWLPPPAPAPSFPPATHMMEPC
jgi:hypothetical protein